ncbi:MAG: hypothetical protein ACK559_13430, partial [bacterium]
MPRAAVSSSAAGPSEIRRLAHAQFEPGRETAGRRAGRRDPRRRPPHRPASRGVAHDRRRLRRTWRD